MSILIAGAGIGGLTAALALSRVGLDVVIIERAQHLAAIGAGLQLSPNATRVLRRLGVLDAIAAKATRPAGIRVRSARSGRVLAYMPLEDAERRWGAPYLVALRADLQTVLADAVEADPGISLRLGTELAGFAMTAQGVKASLRHGAITRTLDADALIGADGIRSTVRARLAAGSADVARETGRTAWRALVDATAVSPARPSAETGVWLGRDAHLVHYPVEGGRLINVVAITREGTPSDPDATWAKPGDAAVVRSRFADWHATAQALVAAAPSWTTWPLFDRAPLAKWSAGPIALLGDAAHPVLPFLAQGAAQAIEDAAALAEACASTPAIAEAFDRYSRARRPRAARVQDASRRLGRVYHLGGAAALARNATMSLVGGGGLLARYDWLYGHTSPDHVTERTFAA